MLLIIAALLLISTISYHICNGSIESPPKFEEACPNKWPDLSLIVPLGLNNDYWHRYLFQSLFLFWPFHDSNSKITIIADDEKKNMMKDVISYVSDHQRHVPGGMNIVYHDESIYYGPKGYDRQQYVMFYPENFTSSEYVGYVDTDTLFFTYVALTDLFYDGKPIINGKSGPIYGNPNEWPFWEKVAESTFSILGMKEPTKCMTYFPVIMKASHLIELRQYLEDKYNKPFYEIFLEYFVGRTYSQFNVMCTYIWTKHKDEYTWYIHEMLPNWDYQHPPAWLGQETDLTQFTEAMKYPKPRVALHAKYRIVDEHFEIHPELLDELLAIGICTSPPIPRDDFPFCNYLQSPYEIVYEEFFKFEYFNWNKVVSYNDRMNALQFRYHQMNKCVHYNYELKQFIEHENKVIRVKEGGVYMSKASGRAIYVMTNFTLRRVPNWDTYLKMALPPAEHLSTLLYPLLRIGPDMPTL